MQYECIGVRCIKLMFIAYLFKMVRHIVSLNGFISKSTLKICFFRLLRVYNSSLCRMGLTFIDAKKKVYFKSGEACKMQQKYFHMTVKFNFFFILINIFLKLVTLYIIKYYILFLTLAFTKVTEKDC